MQILSSETASEFVHLYTFSSKLYNLFRRILFPIINASLTCVFFHSCLLTDGVLIGGTQVNLIIDNKPELRRSLPRSSSWPRLQARPRLE